MQRWDCAEGWKSTGKVWGVCYENRSGEKEGADFKSGKAGTFRKGSQHTICIWRGWSLWMPDSGWRPGWLEDGKRVSVCYWPLQPGNPICGSAQWNRSSLFSVELWSWRSRFGFDRLSVSDASGWTGICKRKACNRRGSTPVESQGRGRSRKWFGCRSSIYHRSYTTGALYGKIKRWGDLWRKGEDRSLGWRRKRVSDRSHFKRRETEAEYRKQDVSVWNYGKRELYNGSPGRGCSRKPGEKSDTVWNKTGKKYRAEDMEACWRSFFRTWRRNWK